MKKLKIRKSGVLIFLLCVIALSGCGNKENLAGDFVINSRENRIDRDFLITDAIEFSQAIDNNPIDNATNYGYGFTGELNMSSIEEFKAYRLLWENELQSALQKLETLLTEEDFTVLVEAQVLWDEASSQVTNFESSLYSMNGYEYGLGGSSISPFVFLVEAQRIRGRTIELLSYIYALSGNVDFVYQLED